MTFAADELVDWGVARTVGGQVAGSGALLSPAERDRLLEDFAHVVPESEALVSEFTGLRPGDSGARAWVMSRRQWLQANLQGFQRIIEPFAQKVTARRSARPLGGITRVTLGAQVGALLGYLGHRVLGQYDLFLPPDDEGLIYFIGPNVAAVEKRSAFPERPFRLWLALHEVTHRLQFSGSGWLRAHVSGLMNSYLDSVELDPKWLLDRLRHVAEEVRSGGADVRAFGWMFLIMTPDQRDMLRRMQALMSLLEGHASFVMNQVGRRRIAEAVRFDRAIHERRMRPFAERVLQRAIGFDAKVRQYDQGERFVAAVVARAGMEGFNRVWDGPASLPTIDEIQRPEEWVQRVLAT